jgi:ribonuclease HII
MASTKGRDKALNCGTNWELAAQKAGYQVVAGVDEVGRGALAGPVVAAAVILDLDNLPIGLNDSKQLTATARETCAAAIYHSAWSWALAAVQPAEIDAINIYQASLRAMHQAIMSLPLLPDYILIDGIATVKELALPQQAIVKGDASSVSIAAASIIAKVSRDRIMQYYHRQWPDYGFAQNVGYGTAAHRQQLIEKGPTPIHRRTFSGVINLPMQLALPIDGER